MKEKNSYEYHALLALPFQETNPEHLDSIFNTLEIKFGLKKRSNQKLIDLGAGNGTIVIHSGLNYGIKSIGIEIDSILIEEAQDRLRNYSKQDKSFKKLSKKVVMKREDIFEQDLRKYDFIYTFALPTIHKFLKNVFFTAKNEAMVISYKYRLNGFDSFLKLEYELKHEDQKQVISTFFYKKF